jgi:hypothetical protein
MNGNSNRLYFLTLALVIVAVLLLARQNPSSFAKFTMTAHQNPSHSADPRSTAAGDWWDEAWPYRVPITVSGEGVVQASVDFGAQFDALGLNQALLDLRAIRVLPDGGATPLPYAEGYSVMLEDADAPQVGWSDSGVYWTVNDGEAEADATRFSQGSGSLKATVENLPGGYGYPGVELHVASGDPLTDWSTYETFIYDVWPQVNASALDQAPDLYWFKLYNACDGAPITQGGPPLALDQWNYASVSLNPLDACWPADGLDLSDITRMEFHTRDNVDGDVSGPNGFWDDGDVLTLWFDNLRLVDQDSGSIRWQTQPGVSQYYIYFDVLTHEGHPLPTLDEGLGSPTLTGSVGTAEAGGYYHQVSGATAMGDLQVWAAPPVEKVLRTMAAPVASAPLQIAAARGEFEPFQIVVRSPSDVSLNVSVSDFSKGGDVISDVTIHRVDYVNITTAGDHLDRLGPWPDPLWPLNDGQAVSFTANANQPLWFTVQVPWDASAGLYQATVSVGSARVPVSLQVWDFSLPREIHLVSEWGFDWSGIVEDVYQGLAGDWDCYWDVVEAFKQDFINHRLIPKGVAWPAGLNYPGGVAYDCNGNLDPDAWGDWDFATIGGKYIHGQDDFNDGYGFPVFLSHGPTSNWPPDSLPHSFCEISRDGVLGSTAFQNKWKQYLGAVDAYIVSDGYDDAAYYHIVNEPQTYDDYTIVGQISALTESAAPHLRQLVSEQVEPDIYNYPGAKIDIWMPTISNYEPVKSHDRQSNHDEEVWWYYLYGDDPPLPNPILMSHPGLEARLTPWLAWAERVDGLLHYDATDWSPNPWTTPNVTGKDNGDGFFFYPPRVDGSDLDSCGQNGNRLVPSIRWENLRDGMEDYEYLWSLAGGDPQIDASNAADVYVAQLVQSRTRFSHVPTDLEATRAAIALALGPPTFEQTLDPPAVAPGAPLTYTLTYLHQGAAATLIATDTVPAITPVVTATGSGLVQVAGQEVYWRVPVSAGLAVSLSIRATAVATPGAALNTVAFAGVPLLDDHMPVLIYSQRIFLPLTLKQENG